MTLAEILSQVLTTAGDELSPKIQGDLDKVKKMFSDLTTKNEQLSTEVDEIEKAKARAESEAISRRKAIAKIEVNLEKQESAVEAKDAEIANLKKKMENPEGLEELQKKYDTLHGENEKFTAEWTKIVAGKRKSLVERFETLKDDPKWEKAKEFFKLPDAKDNKLLWDELSEQDLEANIQKIEEWDSIGFFETKKPSSGFSDMKEKGGETDFSKLDTSDSIGDYLVSAAKNLS